MVLVAALFTPTAPSPAAAAAAAPLQGQLASTLTFLLASTSSGSQAAVDGVQLAACTPAWAASSAALRLAALHALASGQLPPLVIPLSATPAAPAASTPLRGGRRSASAANTTSEAEEGSQGGQLQLAAHVVRLLAASAASDAADACRRAAHVALEAWPVAAPLITPLLRAPIPAPSRATAAEPTAGAAELEPGTATKRARRKKDAPIEPAAGGLQQSQEPIVLIPPGALETAVLVLEMLQWKETKGECTTSPAQPAHVPVRPHACLQVFIHAPVCPCVDMRAPVCLNPLL